MSIGSYMHSVEWWHFRWPWWTLNLVWLSSSQHFWSQISQNDAS